MTEFIDQYKAQYESRLPKARLFELTLPWLAATEESFDIDLEDDDISAENFSSIASLT